MDLTQSFTQTLWDFLYRFTNQVLESPCSRAVPVSLYISNCTPICTSPTPRNEMAEEKLNSEKGQTGSLYFYWWSERVCRIRFIFEFLDHCCQFLKCYTNENFEWDTPIWDEFFRGKCFPFSAAKHLLLQRNAFMRRSFFTLYIDKRKVLLHITYYASPIVLLYRPAVALKISCYLLFISHPSLVIQSCWSPGSSGWHYIDSQGESLFCHTPVACEQTRHFPSYSPLASLYPVAKAKKTHYKTF